jgi:lipid II:glycine glycyltransferase (peptidoglycan interpeptide bridge formation enzyme)
MQFQEITEEKKSQWNEFIMQNSPESFLQSFEWGKFQKTVGRDMFYYGVCEGENIVALALVVEHKLPLGLKYWYIPRGPVLGKNVSEEKKIEILDFFMKRIREKALSCKIIFVRMDPAFLKNNFDVFKKLNLKFVSGSVQPKDTLVLDLVKSEEELLAEMKQKTRYNIRLAEKKGVTVLWENFDENNFEDFWRLIGETSERDGIVSHSRNYYLKMLETLSDENDDLKCRLYFAKHEGKIIAANIVFLFGDYAVYLHGASSNSSRNLMAPYLLQWKQIRDAKEAGCRIYDFWGITVEGENPKWEGITRFKKGFGGREISYTGVCDLPINDILYGLYLRFRKL